MALTSLQGGKMMCYRSFVFPVSFVDGWQQLLRVAWLKVVHTYFRMVKHSCIRGFSHGNCLLFAYFLLVRSAKGPFSRQRVVVAKKHMSRYDFWHILAIGILEMHCYRIVGRWSCPTSNLHSQYVSTSLHYHPLWLPWIHCGLNKEYRVCYEKRWPLVPTAFVVSQCWQLFEHAWARMCVCGL